MKIVVVSKMCVWGSIKLMSSLLRQIQFWIDIHYSIDNKWQNTYNLYIRYITIIYYMLRMCVKLPTWYQLVYRTQQYYWFIHVNVLLHLSLNFFHLFFLSGNLNVWCYVCCLLIYYTLYYINGIFIVTSYINIIIYEIKCVEY